MDRTNRASPLPKSQEAEEPRPIINLSYTLQYISLYNNIPVCPRPTPNDPLFLVPDKSMSFLVYGASSVKYSTTITYVYTHGKVQALAP